MMSVSRIYSVLVLFFLVITTSYTLSGCAGGEPTNGVCGNGILEPGEECDGTSLGGKTCTDLGFSLGRLPVCTEECKLDTSVCNCVDECQLGDMKCQGDFIMMCVNDKGCATWTSYQDCSSQGKMCDDSTDAVTCSDSCSDACGPAGSVQCYGDIVQECTNRDNGCLGWTDKDNCAASGRVCRDGKCECSLDCKVGQDYRCEMTFLEVCDLDANGCPYWKTVKDCSATGAECNDNGSGDAQCSDGGTCSDECSSEGATGCSGSVAQKCIRDSSTGCLVWQTVQDCSSSGKTCQSGVCVGSSSTNYVKTDLSPGGYSHVSGTLLSGSSDTDSDTFHISLPFTFSYYGRDYTDVYVSANGWLSFGTDPGVSAWSNGSLPDGNAPSEALYPYWDDLFIKSSDNPGAGIYYTTEGSSPTRAFVIEWYRASRYNSAGKASESRASFQIVLYEGSNEIEFLYDRANWTNPGSNYAQFSATVGIESDSNSKAVEVGHTFSDVPPSDYRFSSQ